MRKDDIEQNFIALYDSLSAALFRHCFFRLSNRERALELVQETFLKAWEYVQSGQEVKNYKAFVYHIANNLIIDEYRKKKSTSLDVMQEEGFDVANNDEAEIIQSVEISQVKQALNQLPEKYRQVIVMRFIDGATLTEISETTGQSENAISVQLNRAIKMLQNIIRP